MWIRWRPVHTFVRDQEQDFIKHSRLCTKLGTLYQTKKLDFENLKYNFINLNVCKPDGNKKEDYFSQEETWIRQDYQSIIDWQGVKNCYPYYPGY